MSIFTISEELLQNIEHKTHYCDILFVFAQTNPFKVAIDKSNKVLEIYGILANTNDSLRTWLEMLSYEPNSYEKIEVNFKEGISTKEVFLTVCSATANQKKLLIYSHQNWKDFGYSEDNILLYNDSPISMIDRDEAISILKIPTTSIVAISSVVAMDKSTISNSKNSNKQK